MQSFFYCSQTYTYIQIVASERSIIGLKLYYLHAIQRYKLALLFLNVMMGFSLCLRRGTPSKKIGPFLHFVAQVVMASVMCSLRACVRTLTASVSLAFFFCSVSIFFFSLLELTILWTKTNNNFVNVLYSFVQLGSNEFPQKRKVFFLLSWSIIKLEKNHWDCSGYKRTKWIYKNQHFTSWNKLLITNFSHWANKNLCIYWKKEWMFHVFFIFILFATTEIIIWSANMLLKVISDFFQWEEIFMVQMSVIFLGIVISKAIISIKMKVTYC